MVWQSSAVQCSVQFSFWEWEVSNRPLKKVVWTVSIICLAALPSMRSYRSHLTWSSAQLEVRIIKWAHGVGVKGIF